MDSMVMHITTRECLITQPHPAMSCGVVAARRGCQKEGNSAMQRQHQEELRQPLVTSKLPAKPKERRILGASSSRHAKGASPMAVVTLPRFMEELGKLKQETHAGKLKAHDYDGRLARIIGELRERGLDADRAAATAALADALTRGVITAPVQAHLHNRLGLA